MPAITWSKHWHRWFNTAFALFWVGYVLYLFDHYPVLTYPDTDSYRFIAQIPLSSSRFYLLFRSPSLPLLYKLFDNSDNALILFQRIVAILAPLLFASVIIRQLSHRKLKVLAFIVILLLAASRDFFFWNNVLLSESSQLHVFLLLLSVLFLLFEAGISRGWKIALAALFPLILCWWVFIRDTNGYLAVFIGLCGICLAVLAGPADAKRFRPWLTALGLITLALGAVQIKTSDMALRWKFPLVNVLGQRFLTDSERTRYLVESGMPLNPDTAAFRDSWASRADTEAFGDWIYRGKTVYQNWLLTNLFTALGEAYKNLGAVIDNHEKIAEYARVGAEASQHSFSAWVAPDRYLFNDFMVLSCLALGYLGYVRLRRKTAIPTALTCLSVTLMVTAVPMVFLTYHGDAMEITRHGLPVRFQILVGGWLAIFAALNILLDQKKTKLPGS